MTFSLLKRQPKVPATDAQILQEYEPIDGYSPFLSIKIASVLIIDVHQKEINIVSMSDADDRQFHSGAASFTYDAGNTNLHLALIGFESLSIDPEQPSMAKLSGKVQVETTCADTQNQSSHDEASSAEASGKYFLQDVTVEVEGIARKDGKFIFHDPAEIKDALNKAWQQAFGLAYHAAQNTQSNSNSTHPATPTMAAIAQTYKHAAVDQKAWSLRGALIKTTIGIFLVFFVIVTIGLLNKNNSNEVIVSDPIQSSKQQAELVKDTIRSMNIPVPEGNDLGCLADDDSAGPVKDVPKYSETPIPVMAAGDKTNG